LLANYAFIGILLLVAVLVPVAILVIARVVSYKSRRTDKDEVKTSTYECGMETVGTSWIQFNFRYYFYALLFVIFDIETVFLYPWAVHFKQLKIFGFVEMLVFIFILVIGLIYAWRKKVLQWK